MKKANDKTITESILWIAARESMLQGLTVSKAYGHYKNDMGDDVVSIQTFRKKAEIAGVKFTLQRRPPKTTPTSNGVEQPVIAVLGDVVDAVAGVVRSLKQRFPGDVMISAAADAIDAAETKLKDLNQ